MTRLRFTIAQLMAVNPEPTATATFAVSGFSISD